MHNRMQKHITVFGFVSDAVSYMAVPFNVTQGIVKNLRHASHYNIALRSVAKNRLSVNSSSSTVMRKCLIETDEGGLFVPRAVFKK